MTESLNERLAENLDLLRKATRLDPVARKAIADVEDAIDALTEENERLRTALRDISERAHVGRYDLTEIAERALAGTEANLVQCTHDREDMCLCEVSSE